MSDYLNQEAEATIANQLAEKACKGENVSQELNAIPIDERISIARQMEKISTSRTDLPDLQIVVGKDAQGQEHLKDMSVNDGYIFDTDVYDMPNKIAQSTADTMRDHRVQEAYEGIPADSNNAEQQVSRWRKVEEQLADWSI